MHMLKYEKEYSWVIAVILCVASAAFANLGTNLQKLAWKNSLVDKDDISVADTRSTLSYIGFSSISFRPPKSLARKSNLSKSSLLIPLKEDVQQNTPPVVAEDTWTFRKTWLSGLSLTAVGAVLDFVALGFGAQSVVAPLGSLTLVFNLLFANLIHDETVETSDFLNTFLILLGCFITVAFSSKQTRFTPVHTLFELFMSPRFTFYAISTLLIVIFLLMRLRHIETKLGNFTSLEQSSKRQPFERRQRVIYPIISGVCGAQSVLFAKLLDELLLSTLASKGKFYQRGGTLFVLLALVLSMLSQLYFMNEGLRRFSSLLVVPVYQSAWILYSVIGGGIVFKEFVDLSNIQIFGFLIGVSVVVLGVYFLAQREIYHFPNLANNGKADKVESQASYGSCESS